MQKTIGLEESSSITTRGNPHVKSIKRPIKGCNECLGKGDNGGKLSGVAELNSHKARVRENST